MNAPLPHNALQRDGSGPSGSSWHAQEVALMRQFARVMGKSLNPDVVIREMLHLLSEWLGLNRGRVLLPDATRHTLNIRYAYGLTQAEMQRGRFSIGEGVTGKVFQTGQLCVIQDIDREPEYLGRTVLRQDLPEETVAFIALPVQQDNATIGVIAVHRLRSRQRALNDDLEILKTAATLIGQVLRLQEEVARRTADLQQENRSLRQQLQRYDGQRGILGQSPTLRVCLNQVERLGPTDITVLILGESGTGKELFARALHDGSSRRNAPFIKVNCAAIPETLFESEMFGHEKGAFTGALGQQKGRFEQAQGGTLFLDEVGEIPLAQQSKLLRVLQDRTLVRVGGNRDIPLDIRVVAATNRSLSDEVAMGRFRVDLYYRLSVVSMRLPALRERDGDVALLVAHYLHQACLSYQRNIKLTPCAVKALNEHAWPGNIRELQNTMTRLVLMSAQDEVRADDILPFLQDELRLPTSAMTHAPGAEGSTPAYASPAEPSSSADGPLTRPYLNAQLHGRDVLLQAMVNARGNKSAAARALGMTRRQLLYRLELLGFGASPDIKGE